MGKQKTLKDVETLFMNNNFLIKQYTANCVTDQPLIYIDVNGTVMA